MKCYNKTTTALALLALLTSYGSYAQWTMTGGLDEGTCTLVTGLDAEHDFGSFNLQNLTTNGPLNDRAYEFSVSVAGCPQSVTTASLTLDYTRQPGAMGFFYPVENTGTGKGMYITLQTQQTEGQGDIIKPGTTLQASVAGGSADFSVWAIPYYQNIIATPAAGTLHSVVDAILTYQ